MEREEHVTVLENDYEIVSDYIARHTHAREEVV
jgi:hypothetical protein